MMLKPLLRLSCRHNPMIFCPLQSIFRRPLHVGPDAAMIKNQLTMELDTLGQLMEVRITALCKELSSPLLRLLNCALPFFFSFFRAGIDGANHADPG
jgi:hypothetical protein